MHLQFGYLGDIDKLMLWHNEHKVVKAGVNIKFKHSSFIKYSKKQVSLITSEYQIELMAF